MARKAHSLSCGQYFGFGFGRVSDHGKEYPSTLFKESGVVSYGRTYSREGFEVSKQAEE